MVYVLLKMYDSMGKLLRQNGLHVSACFTRANYEKSCIHFGPRDLMESSSKEIYALQVGQSPDITYHLVLLRPPQSRTDRGKPGYEAPFVETNGQLDSMITKKS